MNDSDITDLLNGAAAGVEQRGTVTGAALRGRARQQRNFRLSAGAAAAGVLCVVAAVAVTTGSLTSPDGVNRAGSGAGDTASYKGVSMKVPVGWTQQKVDKDFDLCTAKAKTVYVGPHSYSSESSWGAECKGTVSQPWAWLTDGSQNLQVTPQTAVFPGGGLAFVETPPALDYWKPSDKASPPPPVSASTPADGPPQKAMGPPPPDSLISKGGINPLTGSPQPPHAFPKPNKWTGKRFTLPLHGVDIALFAEDPAVLAHLRAAISVPAPAKQALVLPQNAHIKSGAAEIIGGPFD